MQLKPLDPAFPIQQQFGVTADGAVVLTNLIMVDPVDEEAFSAAWAVDAAYMKSRPGFISSQMHRAVGPQPTFLNYAVWETLDAFRAAFTDPTFQANLAGYPASTVIAPHLFERIAVPGVCVA